MRRTVVIEDKGSYMTFID